MKKPAPDTPRGILNATLASMARKVRRGKALSSGECNILRHALTGRQASEEGYARSQAELAKTLLVSARTIQRHLRIAGNPGKRKDGRYDVAAWRKWFEEHRGIDGAGDLDRTELRARQILLQNQKLEFQLSILRKDFVPAAEVEQWAASMCQQAKKVLLAMPSSLAPQVVGVSVAEAETRMRDAVNDALQQLHTRPLTDTES